MKTTIFSILAAALALGAATAEAITLSLNPSSTNPSVGSTLMVDVDISGLGSGTAPSLGAYDLDIGFDTGVLSLLGAPVFGNQLDLGFGSLTDFIPGSGTINLSEVSLAFDPADLDDNQADSFTLATLSFDVIGPGTSLLTLGIIDLGDANGDPLTASIQNASITTPSTPPGPGNGIPEPATLWLLAFGLAGCLTWRKGG